MLQWISQFKRHKVLSEAFQYSSLLLVGRNVASYCRSQDLSHFSLNAIQVSQYKDLINTQESTKTLYDVHLDTIDKERISTCTPRHKISDYDS
jgi:hypothetical protein